MAKLRTNHNNQGKSGTIIRVGLFAALLAGLTAVFNFFNTEKGPDDDGPSEEVITPIDKADDQEYYLPTSTTGTIVNHTYYSLSYSEEHEQAEWVAYILTRDRLEQPWVDRADRFEADPKVRTKSATWYDYRGSGYDRGHLAPAADMAFNQQAMEESFYMSNISPQAHDFNTGIWRELEENTRTWAKRFKKLYVVTGPILTEPNKGSIGDNEVTVPGSFYRVLLDISEPEKKGIAFILPNQISYEPLYEYVTSIDEVEERTGIDFFPELMTRQLESELEGNYNIDLWEFSKAKHDKRINEWNKR